MPHFACLYPPKKPSSRGNFPSFSMFLSFFFKKLLKNNKFFSKISCPNFLSKFPFFFVSFQLSVKVDTRSSSPLRGSSPSSVTKNPQFRPSSFPSQMFLSSLLGSYEPRRLFIDPSGLFTAQHLAPSALALDRVTPINDKFFSR